MPHITVHVDERTMRVLEREALVRDTTVERLAERAIESSAIATLPGGLPGGFDGQYFSPQPR